MKVSKLDAVRRQLDCALKLWINDDDPVSVHTLAFAAYEIVNDINAKKGNRDSTLLGMTEVVAVPGHVEDVMNYMKKPMTFFKHANRDPHAILEFEPEVNKYIVLLALNGLTTLGEQLSDLQHAFVRWMGLHHPNLVKDGKTMFPGIEEEDIKGMRTVTKRQFFNAFLQGLAINHTRS